MEKYKYVEQYFDLPSRIQMWKKLNCNEDIERVLYKAQGLITYLNNFYPENLDRIRIQEKELGKIEIALDQINAFPGIFTFNEEEIKAMKELYKNLEAQIFEMNVLNEKQLS